MMIVIVPLLILFLQSSFANNPCVFTDPATGFVYDLSNLYSQGDYYADQYKMDGAYYGANIWTNMCGTLHTTSCGANQAGCAGFSPGASWVDISIGSARSMKLQMGYQFSLCF